MTPQTAEQRMIEIQASQRPYVPDVLRKLALSYALPLLLALFLATVGSVVLAQVLPSSTTTVIVFALNVGVFYYGWNYFEKRSHATALFSLYVTGTRERRTLERLIKAAQAGDQAARDDLAVQVKRYEAAAQAFIDRATPPSHQLSP